MLKSIKPGVNALVKPEAGLSRDGQPLSFNLAPSQDLIPWIARLYCTPVQLPPDYTLQSGLLNDTAIIRIQLSGDWQAQTADGMMNLGPAALVFGTQSRFMPVWVKGSFLSIGVALRAGAGHALLGADASKLVDRIVHFEHFGLDGLGMLEELRQHEGATAWFKVVEDRFRAVVESKGRPLPDPVSSAFEALSYSNPSVKITDFAKDIGISLRTLERLVRRDFGLTPKQVLMRARALDMASHLHGVADEEEAEELMLRYFDQAQMTREFTQLFGMSPRKFMATPNPLLTLTLESRQAKRLEALERLTPGANRPWQ